MSSFIEARVNGLLVEWFCKEKEETARSLAERRICLGQVIYDEYIIDEYVLCRIIRIVFKK